eukprot:c6214_g1_i2.p1 GENE.c6214_g1_i2~~c6214_g1_i2.p1  ORF type:complete len:1169 (+),score=268.13 c6214_g1_i2:294-3509(+)
MPEVQKQNPNVPVLLMATKLDRVPEDLRDRVVLRGEKTSKELGCIGFQATSALSSINIQLFERAVQTGLAKKRMLQKMFDTERKKNPFLSTLRQHKQVSMPDLLKAGNAASLENQDIQGVVRVTKITTSTADSFYSWRGEIVCSLVEDLLDGRSDMVLSSQNFTENLSLEHVSTSAGEVCLKLMLFYYFMPLVNNSFEAHNLDFWFEIEDFKYNKDSPAHKSTRKLKKEARRMVETYINRESPKEVNVDDDVRNDVMVKVGAVSHHRVFDLAQLHVLNHLVALFKSDYVGSFPMKHLLTLFKGCDLVEISNKDMDIELAPKATGAGMGRMLRSAIHVMTLMEFLHSSTASDKRPLQADFMKEQDPIRIVQLAAKYLLLFCALKVHIDKEKSQENVLFWLDAEDFRSLIIKEDEDIDERRRTRESMTVRAIHIVEKYIRDDAPLPVNLPAHVSKQIKAQVKELADANASGALMKREEQTRLLHIFDAAQREILLLMKRDSWRRFQASDEARTIRNFTVSLFSTEAFVDPEKEKAQQKFQAKFDLMSDETLMRSFPCALEKLMTLHGTLSISRRHMCFSSSVFGFRTNLCFNFANVSQVKKGESAVAAKARGVKVEEESVIVTTTDGQTFSFKNILPNRNQLYYALNKARTRVVAADEAAARPRIKDDPDADVDDEMDRDEMSTMNEKDWEAFKEGATVKEFQAGEVVLAEGTPTGSMYQIARGSCKIIKQSGPGDAVTVIRKCTQGEIIGEISFIEGGATSASVVADSNDVVVYVMNRDFVERALINNPGLTGRFYKFLAVLLADRIRTKVMVPVDRVDNIEQLSPTQFQLRFNLKDRKASVVAEWSAALGKGKIIQLYGTLYLSQTVLCFASGVLGSSTRLVIPFNEITHVEIHNKALVLKLRGLDDQHTFHDIDSVDAAKEAIQAQISLAHRDSQRFLGVFESGTADLDWSIFLSGAELQRYRAGQPILQQGELTSYIYQVGHGSAVVQRTEGGNVQNVREMKVGELFGEMAFLQGGAASATIVAGHENTIIYCIKKQFVDSLLYVNANAELPGRFYKFLATSLAGRLRN